MTRRLLEVEGRRHFVKSASAFALAATALPPVLACMKGAPSDARRPSRISVAGREEMGTRLLMRGTVYGADGRPAPSARVFVYHTDADGFYNRGENNPRLARLRGTLWTDAEGRYEFDTVRPAHYANVAQPPPMHIHVHLESKGLPDHWVESFYFEGDPHLPPDDIARPRARTLHEHRPPRARRCGGARRRPRLPPRPGARRAQPTHRRLVP